VDTRGKIVSREGGGDKIGRHRVPQGEIILMRGRMKGKRCDIGKEGQTKGRGPPNQIDQVIRLGHERRGLSDKADVGSTTNDEITRFSIETVVGQEV
jgi:hypothetical protein